jgi:hypothetical protein
MWRLTDVLRKIWTLLQPEGRDDYSIQMALQLGLRPIPVRSQTARRRNYIVY